MYHSSLTSLLDSRMVQRDGWMGRVAAYNALTHVQGFHQPLHTQFIVQSSPLDCLSGHMLHEALDTVP